MHKTYLETEITNHILKQIGDRPYLSFLDADGRAWRPDFEKLRWEAVLIAYSDCPHCKATSTWIGKLSVLFVDIHSGAWKDPLNKQLWHVLSVLDNMAEKYKLHYITNPDVLRRSMNETGCDYCKRFREEEYSIGETDSPFS